MSSRLRRPAVALVTTALAASALGFVPPASAVAVGSISGTVTGPSGQLLGDISVTVYQYDEDGAYWESVDSDYTNGDGVYSIALPDGAYRLQFRDYSGDHATEYYNNADFVEDGQTVTVPGSAAADVQLEPGAHVSGEVTGPENQPLDDVVVAVYRVVGAGNDEQDYRFVAFDTTDAGTYDVGGLADGTYVVGFEDVFGPIDTPATYATEYYDDQPNKFVAERITLAAGATRDAVDAKLELDSVISGTVVDASGAPVADGDVTAYSKAGSTWQRVAYATVVDGAYSLDGLAAGTYRVGFSTFIDGRDVTEFWNDKSTVDEATDVVVGAAGRVSGIDAQMVYGEHDLVVRNETAPVISGTPRVGSPLTSSAGTWSPTPNLVEYYWVAGEELVQSGTSATYVPTAADLGKVISVYVYASAEGYDYGFASAVSSGPVVAAAAPPVATPTPTPTPVVTPAAALTAILTGLDVKGAPKVGSTVKLTGLDASFRTAVKYKLQWYAGSKAIKKATKSKLKITSAMKGKKISVKVTATAAGAKVTKKLILGKAR